MTFFLPARIVSGGQTGVDRGALEAAIALGIEHGGWCPQDRLAEDGSIPSRYDVRELKGADYAQRTEQNVIDSDATLILYEGNIVGGTKLTQRFAVLHAKPTLTARIGPRLDVSRIRDWLAKIEPRVLNVAGPRESKCPGIQHRSMLVMLQILEGHIAPIIT